MKTKCSTTDLIRMGDSKGDELAAIIKHAVDYWSKFGNIDGRLEDSINGLLGKKINPFLLPSYHTLSLKPPEGDSSDIRVDMQDFIRAVNRDASYIKRQATILSQDPKNANTNIRYYVKVSLRLKMLAQRLIYLMSIHEFICFTFGIRYDTLVSKYVSHSEPFPSDPYRDLPAHVDINAAVTHSVSVL